MIIAGPTCTGKSSVAVRLAELIDGEVVSADSMQVYRGMDIGTAKITKEEMRGVEHHLIDVVDPDVPFTADVYRGLAKSAIDGIRSRGKVPIIAGGTGFYIESILFEQPDSDPGTDPVYRESLRRMIGSGMLPALYEELSELDPEYASTVHPNNSHRISRALEYMHVTGRRYSEYTGGRRMVLDDFRLFVLEDDREALYNRIDDRVDRMFESGFLDEVRGLMDAGIPRDSVSMQGVGYRQVHDHLSGAMELEDAISSIKFETHHIAKRQVTWFRRMDFAERIDIASCDHDVDRIASRIMGSCGVGH